MRKFPLYFHASGDLKFTIKPCRGSWSREGGVRVRGRKR